MNPDEIRINMVINKHEFPALFSVLEKTPSKVRASILRKYSDFGLWAQTNLKDLAVSNHQVSKLNENHSMTVSASLIGTSTSLPIVKSPASVKTADKFDSSVDVLDTSVLDGVDLGELD